MVEWQEIRKKVWAILNEKNEPVEACEILKWVKQNYGDSLPSSYLDDEYVLLRMLIGKTFQAQDGTELMIDFNKRHPVNESIASDGRGWLFLGKPKIIVGTVTLSKVSNATTAPAPKKGKPVQVSAAEPAVAVKPVTVAKPEVKETEIEPHMGCEITPITQALIPVNDGYIPRKMGNFTDIDILKKCFLTHRNIMLSGPPGGGKSAAVKHFCYKYRLPYVRVECHGGIEIADLVGQWTPNPECAGKFIWQDGLLTQLVRHGGVFVGDEINGMPREFALKFHGLLDDERRLILTEKDGEVINAHPRFMFVGCQNPGAEGTRRLNNAFFDRFHVVIEYDYDTEIEKKIIDDEFIRNFAVRARSMHGKELETFVSTRLMKHYVSNCEDFDEDAAAQFFLNKFDAEERQKVKEVYDLVVRGRKKRARKPEEVAAGLGALFG